MMHKLGHIPYIEKQTIEFEVASFATTIVSGTNYVWIGSQDDPILHEHVVQGCHVVHVEVLLVFVHLSTHTCSRELPSHLNYLALCTM
jgi:hypothetical protein